MVGCFVYIICLFFDATITIFHLQTDDFSVNSRRQATIHHNYLHSTNLIAVAALFLLSGHDHFLFVSVETPVN